MNGKALSDRAYDRIASVMKNRATTSIEDALFITKESRNMDHVLHLVKIFGRGVISHPESWWATNFQILAYLGFFGATQKYHAIIRQTIFLSLIGYGFHHPVRTGSLFLLMKTSHLDEAIAGMLGRYLGAQFITNRAVFSKRFSLINNFKHGGKLKLLSGFVHSSYGLGMLAIAQGVRSLENLLFCMLTGSQAVLNGDFYKVLDKMPISDYEAYQAYDEVKLVLQQLLFLNTESGYKQYAQWNL